jgi:aspartate-semialdehyde dehydrogenase
MAQAPVIAVAGATGLVGNEILVLLEERKVPFRELRLFASADSVGEIYRVGSAEVAVELLEEDALEGVDYVLFATSAELSARFVPIAKEKGAISIDNSRHYRMQEGVPLVVPEVNGHLLHNRPAIIANPNCSTIQLVPVLQAIHQAAGLKRVVVSTYQSVSGAGKAALDELWEQTLAIFNQREFKPEEFPHQIAFNCIPQIDVFEEDGYTREEHKIMAETRKILGLPELPISATAVRVPVLHSHAESVNVETERPLSPQQLIEVLSRSEGIEVTEEPQEYPLQIETTGTDVVRVGRIRQDRSVQYGLNLWIVADNLRKGAALNAVQILESLLQGATPIN